MPDCQPASCIALRTALAVTLAATLALPSAAHAQSRPLGAAPDEAPGLRATLGECRAELLRQAWNEMLPLEAEAVEREVLALCTERSEAIAGVLAAQSRIDAALAELRASAAPSETAGSAAAAPDNARMDRLRGEIAGLRSRIARLEGQPERPETEATLADLRGDLATSEAELARLEGGVTASGDPDALATVPADPASAETVGPASAPETLPPPGSGLLVPGPETGAPGPQAADGGIAAVPPTDGAGTSLPPPGALPPGTSPAMSAAASAAPQSGPTEWRAVFAVRRDGGPWLVRLQGSREILFPVPASTAGDADDTAAIPSGIGRRSVTESDPPVDLSVGDLLPDGTALLGVTPEGVEIGDPDDPDAETVLVRFATAGDSEPGALEWDFQVIGGEQE